ncbi:MAG: hypothetical protein A3H27_12150 [Acidobacteria bacterium RIFCSPLOWO2_02_FULL_59_13]|nr:MAG: hypothetical protein A3H27_12150 [Acidobacteria bacterium RIFCSPLOWO2_02_FULL_59_13]
MRKLTATRLHGGSAFGPRRLLRTAVCLCAAIFLPTLVAAQDSAVSQRGPATESGVFSVFSGNQQIGSEKFTITRTDTGIEAAGEIQLEPPGGPAISESTLLRLDPQLQPSFYERRQKSPRQGTLTAQFGPSETTLVASTEAGTDHRIFYLPSSRLAVLDTNFFHHYSILLRQYEAGQGDAQSFNVFIPQEALPGTVSLLRKGRENQTVGRQTLDLDHFQVVSDEMTIDLWATAEGEIQRISIPQANLEILRQR